MKSALWTVLEMIEGAAEDAEHRPELQLAVPKVGPPIQVWTDGQSASFVLSLREMDWVRCRPKGRSTLQFCARSLSFDYAEDVEGT